MTPGAASGDNLIPMRDCPDKVCRADDGCEDCRRTCREHDHAAPPDAPSLRSALERVLLGRRFGNGISTSVIDEVMAAIGGVSPVEQLRRLCEEHGLSLSIEPAHDWVDYGPDTPGERHAPSLRAALERLVFAIDADDGESEELQGESLAALDAARAALDAAPEQPDDDEPTPGFYVTGPEDAEGAL